MKLLITILFFGMSITFAQNDTTRKIMEEPLICQVVEKMPEIIGGLDSLQIRVKYPPEALINQVEGKVYVLASVDTTGNASDLKIIKGIGYGCDEESLRVISNAKFNPALIRGKKIKCLIAIPIKFELPKNK